MSNPRDAQFASEFTGVVSSAFDKVTVNVFLCGKARSGKSRTPSARDIRSFLQTKLEAEFKSCRVKLGEHKGLMKVYKQVAGKAAFNLADHEFALAKTIDLLVIFPCSPGSFAELGMFSREDTIAPKMAIFLDSKFRRSKGYIVDGPIAAARLRHSQVFTLDYSDQAAVLAVVKDLVMIRRALKGQQRLLTP